MKRYLPHLTLCLLQLFSCREKSRVPATDRWADARKAYAFRYKQNDSAYYYFNRIATTSKDSLQIAVAYNIMGGIQSDAGDDYGNQESQTLSLKYLDTQKPSHRPYLATDYNELGMADFNLKRYDEAISFYQRALDLSTDPALKAVILNNQGNAYQQKKAYDTAIRFYLAAIRLEGTQGNDYPRLLTNLATTRWLQDRDYNAAPELLLALRIRLRQKDLWGEHASYAHLADFYNTRSADSALHYTKLQLTAADRINSPADQVDALGKLISLDPGKNARSYFERYQHLDDSIQTARNAAKNQFALIRYNVERNRAENLLLQKDNAENQYQLLVRNILLVVGCVLLAAGTVYAWMWYRRYRKRKELEKQEAVRETWRQAAKDVHDSLSNDIYVLMKKLKHDPVMERDELRRQAEAIYARARNISYELLPDTGELFVSRIGELLKSFGTEQTKVALVGNSQAFWQKVSAGARSELKLILRELMVNMEKHSRAGNVVIRFEAARGQGQIIYMDDGVGVSAGTPHQNGLQNAGTRIQAIGGQVIFGTNDGKGLQVTLTFPNN